MPGTYKSDAVWHNFKPSDFPTMALGGRRDHPSRAYFYEWLARQARQSAPRLTWCDVGVLSMVDYLSSLFAVEAIVELDSRLDGRNKPNQIFIGIKPGYPQRARPDTITVVPSRIARWLRSVKGAIARSGGMA